MSQVVVRFAPSPTGYLHIGGARTALFNWAYARRHSGRFLLRIEDTDEQRSAAEHSQAIIDSLRWLGLNWDGDAIYQSQNIACHQEIAERLVKEKKAYYCDCTQERLRSLREQQTGGFRGYDRRCRDKGLTAGEVIRLKTAVIGQTTFHDEVFGDISTNNAGLDDMVLLRADGKPTYNLANVADDIETKITHVIRGDDHIMNTYRQLHIYAALDAKPPRFAHFPMILGAVEKDGEVRYERMSKRNAAVDVRFYREQGFLAEAIINYLARLSWSCGDVEFFNSDFLCQHFDFSDGQTSPARFDMDKLKWLNREHLRLTPNQTLRDMASLNDALSDDALTMLKDRCETLADMQKQAEYFIIRPQIDDELLNAHLPQENRAAFNLLINKLTNITDWKVATIKTEIKQTAKQHSLKFGDLGMPMRVLLTGKTQSPDIAEVAAVLGQEESLRRIGNLKVEDIQ